MIRFRVELIFTFLLLGLGCSQESDHKVHVTYWEKWNGFEAEAMQKVVDAFNESQEKIVVEYLSTSEVDRKTILATTGGDPPDLAGIWANGLSIFADMDALTPLDDFIKADGLTTDEWLARYYPVYADMCVLRGKIVALPTTPTAHALYWNKSLFREAGLDPERPPRTLDELNAFSEKLTKRDPQSGKFTQMGFLPQEPGLYVWAFIHWFGGGVFDGKMPTIGTNPANKKYFDWVQSFPKKYGVDAIKEFSGGFGNSQSPQNAFISGKVAMVFHGVWLSNFIKRFSPGMEYGVAAIPTAIPGQENFSVADEDVIAIPKGAKHPHEAWEFIKYLHTINPHAASIEELRGEELLCFSMEKNSPLKEWSPFFEQHHPHPFIKVFRQLANSPNIIHAPKIAIWQEYNREINNAFQGNLLLLESPEESLGFVQKRMDESWGWYTRRLKRFHVDQFTEESNLK